MAVVVKRRRRGGRGVGPRRDVDRVLDALGHCLAEHLDDRAGSDLDPDVVAHKALDTAQDARGQHDLVPDGDLLVDLHGALAPLALGPDQEHVTDGGP